MKRVLLTVVCCLLSVVAQSAELSLKVKSKYLNLPISQDAERRKLTFQAKGVDDLNGQSLITGSSRTLRLTRARR